MNYKPPAEDLKSASTDELKAAYRYTVGTVIQYDLERDGRSATYKRFCNLWWELCDRGEKEWCLQCNKEEREVVRKMRSKK